MCFKQPRKCKKERIPTLHLQLVSSAQHARKAVVAWNLDKQICHGRWHKHPLPLLPYFSIWSILSPFSVSVGFPQLLSSRVLSKGIHAWHDVLSQGSGQSHIERRMQIASLTDFPMKAIFSLRCSLNRTMFHSWGVRSWKWQETLLERKRHCSKRLDR